MGEIKFTTKDFLDWESSTGKAVVDKLFPHVKALGDELAQELKQIGAHESHPQKSQDDYLGINLMRKIELDQKIAPYKVPHFSCALTGRVLTLFITCEGKELVKKLVRVRYGLEPKVSDALWKVKSNSLPGLGLEISEKLHLVAGGHGKNATVRSDFVSFPLELCQSEKDVQQLVHQAFDAMDHLLNSDASKKKVQVVKTVHPKMKAISVSGVVILKYEWNWLELEHAGTSITEEVKEVASQLRLFYNVLLEAYDGPMPRKSRKSR